MRKETEKKLISKVGHKYAIGQTCFILKKNRIVKVFIKKIYVTIYDLNEYSIEYAISEYGRVEDYQINENAVFEKQEEIFEEIKVEQ